MAKSDLVLKHTEKRVATLTLNRPEKRNALNPALVAELFAHLNEIEKDDTIRAVVLKGAGKVFCAGADLAHLKALQTNTYDQNLADSSALASLFKRLLTLSKLTIAQVHGAAIAGGAGLATACDFCFSTPEAKFGYTEVRIGFIPAIVSTFLLQKFGAGLGRKLLLTGEIFDGTTAAKMGIVTQVAEADLLAERINIFAQDVIQSTAPDSIALTKALLYEIKGLDYDTALKTASEFNAKSRDSNDCKRGIENFLQKQKITW